MLPSRLVRRLAAARRPAGAAQFTPACLPGLSCGWPWLAAGASISCPRHANRLFIPLCSPPGAQALEALEGEVGVQAGDLEAKYKGLLEKKWTSVVRLQKKVWRRP